MKRSIYIIQKFSKYFLALIFFLIFFTHQAKADCIVDGVQFDVDFEIKNKFLNLIMTKSFQFGLNKIADAFQKKAENL